MMHPDPFHGVTIFIQVVESGSFTLAAQRLGMTKSGVSKSVSTLEAALGVRLFHRTTRRLSLTEEGMLYAEGCTRAREEIASVQDRMRAHHKAPTGRLRINLPLVFGQRWVVPALLDIAHRYPALALDISLTDRPLDLVEEGYDMAVRIGPLEDSATLVAKPLGVQKAVLCAHPDYLGLHGVPRTLADLAQHQCITAAHGDQALAWHFLDRHGRRQPYDARGRLRINHAAGIFDAALAGLGIALLSDWLVGDAVRDGRLVEVMAEVPKEGFIIHAVWPKSRHLSPKVRLVADSLAQQFLPNPPWEWAAP